jgi:hypothetical protein
MDSILSRQRYTCDDTFFVESDEISGAERVREQLRAFAKVRQRELAAELSVVTSDEYLEEILDHMEHMEVRNLLLISSMQPNTPQANTMPDVNSIDIQHEIQWYMRPYLLDFLVEAHMAFQLLPETLYLTVNLLDRYCSRRVVYKKHYQLVACSALLIAAKYGDKKDRVPTFRELRSVCCQFYEEEMFMQMEWHVLQTLDYVLGHPTVESFLQIALAETAHNDVELMHMTWYICDIALYHRDFVSVRPSVLARSALALGRAVLQRPQLPADLWAGSFDSSVIMNLFNCLPGVSDVLARKYHSTKLSSVAETVDSFVRSQQQQQQQQQQRESVQVCRTPEPGYCLPSTPHRSGYDTAIVQHGCLTPPITPDNDMNVCPPTVYPQPPTNYPATPSPVPSYCEPAGPPTIHHAFYQMQPVQ